MHVPTNVKSPNNTSKWQMGFNSAFKGLIRHEQNMMIMIMIVIIIFMACVIFLSVAPPKELLAFHLIAYFQILFQ